MSEDLENQKEGYILHGNYIGDKGPAFGTRHVQILLVSFCILIGMAMRISLSIQIVAMTNPHSTSPNPDIPIYKWNNSGVILSSLFWSYVVINVLAPPLEKKYGPKWILFWAILLNTIAFILIPFSAAHAGSTGVIVCRIIQGIGQGVLFPTQQIVLGLWAPAEERATAGSVTASGVTIGAVLGSLASGYLSTTWWGWPSSFYLFGAMGLLWCTIYLFLGQNSPATHPRITSEEKRYIQMSLNQYHNEDVPIPWKSFITSVHVWAIFAGHIGFAWSMTLSFTESSTFLANVMKFNIKSNGIYSALPPGIGLFSGFIFGFISDYIINHHYISTLNCRRIFQLIGGFGLVVCLISLSFLNESQRIISVIIMVLMNVAQTALLCGHYINIVDLSPRFAGIIYGLVNAIAHGTALFAPILVDFFVTDQGDINQWRTIFLLTSSIIAGATVFFVIFASGEQQPWDGPKKQRLEANSRKSSIKSISGSILNI